MTVAVRAHRTNMTLEAYRCCARALLMASLGSPGLILAAIVRLVQPFFDTLRCTNVQERMESNLSKAKQTALDVLDRSLPNIQAKIVRRVRERIDQGAEVSSIEGGIVVKKHRKRVLAAA